MIFKVALKCVHFSWKQSCEYKVTQKKQAYDFFHTKIMLLSELLLFF